jgi:hypothetical protein
MVIFFLTEKTMTEHLPAIPEGDTERRAFWARHIDGYFVDYLIIRNQELYCAVVIDSLGSDLIFDFNGAGARVLKHLCGSTHVYCVTESNAVVNDYLHPTSGAYVPHNITQFL